MALKIISRWFFCLVAAALLTCPVWAQANRGKAELNAAGGKIDVDYGRPQLKGRDPLTWQKDKSYWRMGMNEMTTINTPVDLVFGAVKLPKGAYGLWLLKLTADRYELVFNSITAGMGMTHDKAKDVASVPLKKEDLPTVVEAFTIDLKNAPKGGIFIMTWGSVKLSADFQFGK
jgi:hypothetical protein